MKAQIRMFDLPITDLMQRFNTFWCAYPKKASKGQAEKTWRKIKPSDELLEEMLKAIERAKNSRDWKKDNGRYIPYPSTWLNAKGWEDEIQEDGFSQFMKQSEEMGNGKDRF